MSRYEVSEMFHSIQGEGLYSGTAMTFVRFAGCSVGKKICHACDTDFELKYPWRGGGDLSPADIAAFIGNDLHVCATGGEPLDQDLQPLFDALTSQQLLHIETSGTRDFRALPFRDKVWITVSPKPGYIHDILAQANEVKIIVPGLGAGGGWPSLEVALAVRALGVITYIQPRNERNTINQENLAYCQDIVRQHPQLRLSVQLHKLLRVR